MLAAHEGRLRRETDAKEGPPLMAQDERKVEEMPTRAATNIVWLESMWAAAAALLLFYPAAGTAWADGVPSAIEFRAAYCARIMQWSVRQRHDNQTMLAKELRARQAGLLPKSRAALSDETLQAMLQHSKEEEAHERAMLEKLNRYLAPRISDLDPEAMRAASQRAEADIQAIADLNGKCGFKCAHGPDFEACLAEKCRAKELLKRFDGCRRPTWFKY